MIQAQVVANITSINFLVLDLSKNLYQCRWRQDATLLIWVQELIVLLNALLLLVDLGFKPHFAEPCVPREGLIV